MATAAIPRLDDHFRYVFPAGALRVESVQGARIRGAKDGGKAPNGEAYDHAFIASTERVATDGGIIKTSAWNIAKMRKRWISNHDIYNSRLDHIVLGHIVYAEIQQGLPVSQVGPSGRALVEYVKYGRTEFAQNVFMLFEDGDLDEVSVRWDPRTEVVRVPYDQEMKANPGVQWVAEYVEQLELSGVVIAADAGATKRGQILPVVNPRVLEAFERVRAHGAGKALPALESFIRRFDFANRIALAIGDHVEKEIEMAKRDVSPLSAADVVAAQLAGAVGVYGDTTPASVGVVRDDETIDQGKATTIRDDDGDDSGGDDGGDMREAAATVSCCGCGDEGQHTYRLCRACVGDMNAARSIRDAMTAEAGTGGSFLVGMPQDEQRVSYESVHPMPDAEGNQVPSAVTTANDEALAEGAVRKCSRCMRSKRVEDLMPACKRCYGSMPPRASNDAVDQGMTTERDDVEGYADGGGDDVRVDDLTVTWKPVEVRSGFLFDVDAIRGKKKDVRDDDDAGGDDDSSDGDTDDSTPDGDGDADDEAQQTVANTSNAISSAANALQATNNALLASTSAKKSPSKKKHLKAQNAHAVAASVNKHAFNVSGDAGHATNALMHDEHSKMHGLMATQYTGNDDGGDDDYRGVRKEQPQKKSEGVSEYGDVKFADPKQGKYPIDTKEHAKAAWSYINMPKNASGYSPDELSAIKGRIKAALKKFGVETSEDGRSAEYVEGRGIVVTGPEELAGKPWSKSLARTAVAQHLVIDAEEHPVALGLGLKPVNQPVPKKPNDPVADPDGDQDNDDDRIGALPNVHLVQEPENYDDWSQLKDGTYSLAPGGSLTVNGVTIQHTSGQTFKVQTSNQGPMLGNLGARDETQRFNPNHDAKGEFSSGEGGSSVKANMTKSHFAHIAQTLNNMGTSDEVQGKAIGAFKSALKSTNPAFDADKFETAATTGKGAKYGASMTKQHYAKIAETINNMDVSDTEKAHVASEFATDLHGTNANFNPTLFKQAATGVVKPMARKPRTYLELVARLRGMDVGAANDVLMAIFATLDALDAVLSAVGPVREQLDGNFAELRNLMTAQIDAPDSVLGAVDKAMGGNGKVNEAGMNGAGGGAPGGKSAQGKTPQGENQESTDDDDQAGAHQEGERIPPKSVGQAKGGNKDDETQDQSGVATQSPDDDEQQDDQAKPNQQKSKKPGAQKSDDQQGDGQSDEGAEQQSDDDQGDESDQGDQSDDNETTLNGNKKKPFGGKQAKPFGGKKSVGKNGNGNDAGKGAPPAKTNQGAGGKGKPPWLRTDGSVDMTAFIDELKSDDDVRYNQNHDEKGLFSSGGGGTATADEDDKGKAAVKGAVAKAEAATKVASTKSANAENAFTTEAHNVASDAHRKASIANADAAKAISLWGKPSLLSHGASHYQHQADMHDNKAVEHGAKANFIAGRMARAAGQDLVGDSNYQSQASKAEQMANALKAAWAAMASGDPGSVQGKPKEIRDDDALVQGKAKTVRDEDEMMQGDAKTVRDEDEMMQGDAKTVREEDELVQGAAKTVRDEPKPYGDVTYADPKNGKYPINTKEHAKAAWSYINQAKNAAKYSPDELATIKGHIKSALSKFGVTTDDERADDEMMQGDSKEIRFDPSLFGLAPKADEAVTFSFSPTLLSKEPTFVIDLGALAKKDSK